MANLRLRTRYLAGTAFLAVWLGAGLAQGVAQTPSFQIAPAHTEIRTGDPVGVGAVLSGGSAVSYVWKKATVVVGSGSAVATNDWKSVAAGANHTLALKNDGSLWGWGSNQSGQLALTSSDAGTDKRSAPTRIGTASDWVSLFASGDRSGAIKKDGSAWYWGGPSAQSGMRKVGGDLYWESAVFGEMGNMYLISLGGLYFFQPDMDAAPSLIGSARDWASVSSSQSMTVALKRDGTLWAYNGMGTGTASNSANDGFYQVQPGRWKAACAGSGFAVALRADGTLWAWQSMGGSGGGWSLFANNWQSQYNPRQLGNRSDWKSLSADVLPLAVDGEGRVHLVAEQWSMQVEEIPVACRSAVGRGSNSTKYFAEGLALGADGTLWAWGADDYGQLGDAQDTASYTQNFYSLSAVQVGVNRNWGLSLPVLGVPLGMTLPNFQPSDLGIYDLQINGVSARSVALALWGPQLEPRRLAAGAALQLTASGTLGAGATPTHQWYRNGVAVSGATSQTYNLASAQPSASGVYWLETSRGGVAARSQSVAVVVEESTIANVHNQLASKSHTAAAESLRSVLQSTPSHPTANVLKALTDLYLFTKDSTTVQMLADLGFTGSADPLNFTLKHTGFPAGGALTSKTRDWMRNTLYPKLRDADVLLGNVTSETFLASLVDGDFGSTGTDVHPFDFGDVQIARAGLNLAMSLLKWVETQNTDVGFLTLNNRREAGSLSLESLLALYPDLLKASATASEAQTEFLDHFGKAISYYLKFSAFANPAPGATGSKRLDPEQAIFTLTNAEDRESERRLKLDCERLQASIAATSAGAGLQSFSLPTSGFEGTLAVQASPWVFFKHAPGWRSELPAFKANAYVPGSLRADTPAAFYPALKLRDLGRVEADLASAEPQIARWLKTGRETVPPTLQISTISSGTSAVTLQNSSLTTNGWLTVSGTVADATGVGRVVVTRALGADIDSAVATMTERNPMVGSTSRVFDWTVGLPADRVVTGGTISVSAWDLSGNVASVSRFVSMNLGALSALTLVPETAREVTLGSVAALAAVVPSGGTVQFTWRRNGASFQSGTASAVDDWAIVSAGGDHTAAIKRDGTLWSWGSNVHGRLGAGGDRQFPQRVGAISSWATVSCGANFTVAMTSTGYLFAAGNSPFGSFPQLTEVTAVSGPWAAVSCSDSHALALTRGGRIFVWSGGTATALDNATDWVEVTAGRSGGGPVNFALKRDGTLWAWGDNSKGALGVNRKFSTQISTPVQVGSDKDWMAVSTNNSSDMHGNGYSVALKRDGTMWAWGFAPFLFGNQELNGSPMRVGPRDARWSKVAASPHALLATRADGRLFHVGNDWFSAESLPSGVASLTVSTKSFGAVGTDGVLWMWGWNNFGQLGNYTPQDLSRPWQDWRITYAPDPIQVGVNPGWGLPSPVRGIPVPLSVENVQADGLGIYNLTVTRGTSSASSVATFYTRGPVSPIGATYLLTAVGGGSLQLQGGINAGNSTVSYQWYKNGVPVPGGTSSELSVAPALGNAGVYWVQAVSGKTSIRGTAMAAVVDSANVWHAHDALNARNLSLASTKINAALVENPNDGPALFMRAVLDLYNLWSDPALATQLAALGFSGSPDPLNLTLQWSFNGFPKGALTAPARAWLMENLYPKLAAVEANLAKITDTGFISAFGPYDLGLQGEDSIVDYGDVQLLRALLNTGLAALKWFETQNTDVDLAALQLDRQNGRLSIESLLSKYPQLLSASATAPTAQAEFVSRFKQALDRYKAFSDFVNPAVAAPVGQRQNQFIGTARLETEEDRTSERDFREAVNKTLESINATDALTGRRTVQTSGGANLTASPYAFFQHAPGWRNDLPKFTRNAYQRNTLNRSLVQSFYPAFTLTELSDVEDAFVRAEPGLTQLLGTREDSTPPTVAFNSVNSLSSYDGWVNLEGTVQDNVGVRRVLVTVGVGAPTETLDAELEELPPAADGTRLYKWRAALPLFGSGTGTLAFSISAEDVFGAVVDSPVVKVLPVERMVPLTVGSRGEGDLTYTVTPAADENGYVRLGAKLVLTARPKPGSLLRRIDTAIDGETLPQPAYRSSTLTLTIRGETAVSAVFEPNPYLLAGGRNRMAGGILVSGVAPMMGLQVALTQTGSFSGRLKVGLSSYAIAGRFDADGFYSLQLPAQFMTLSWPTSSVPTVPTVSSSWRPIQTASLPLTLRMWVDTSNGIDQPAIAAQTPVGRISLVPLAPKDYVGQPTFTGYLVGGATTTSPSTSSLSSVARGVSQSVNALWNRTPGWWTVSVRNSGAAIVTGAVPARGRYAFSGYVFNQSTVNTPSTPGTAPGEYADLEALSAVAADTALRWKANLYSPHVAGDFMTNPTSSPACKGALRTEMWYPGNRGPIFESSAPSAVGTSSYAAFVGVGTLEGVGFVPAASGQIIAPFVSNATPANTPRNLAVRIGFGVGTNASTSVASYSSYPKAFELQATTRNVVGVVPGSAGASLLSNPQMSLNPTSGILTGSAVRWGKRVSLQGVLLQRTFSGGTSPSNLENVYGGGLTSDGDPFVITDVNP